jgi:hypothetical protein
MATNSTICSKPASEYKLIFNVIRAVDIIVQPVFYIDLTPVDVIYRSRITKIKPLLHPFVPDVQCFGACINIMLCQWVVMAVSAHAVSRTLNL